MNRYEIKCVCGTIEHSLWFSWLDYNTEDNYPLMFVEVFLNSYPWYQRFWYGIKYILGFKSKSGAGHFDEALLDFDQAIELRDLCNKFLKTKE